VTLPKQMWQFENYNATLATEDSHMRHWRLLTKINWLELPLIIIIFFVDQNFPGRDTSAPPSTLVEISVFIILIIIIIIYTVYCHSNKTKNVFRAQTDYDVLNTKRSILYKLHSYIFIEY
jgi:uncharacterized membrane protein YidH (DUF202 family)